MPARLRTRWTVETHRKGERLGSPISTLHFDRLSEIKDHLDQHREHRFVVHPPTGVHSEDLCALDDLRQTGFDIDQL